MFVCDLNGLCRDRKQLYELALDREDIVVRRIFFVILTSYLFMPDLYGQISDLTASAELAIIDYFNNCTQVNKKYVCTISGERVRVGQNSHNKTLVSSYVIGSLQDRRLSLLCVLSADATAPFRGWTEVMTIKGDRHARQVPERRDPLTQYRAYKLEKSAAFHPFFHPVYLPIGTKGDLSLGRLSLENYYEQTFENKSQLSNARYIKGNLIGRWEFTSGVTVDIEFGKECGNMPINACWRTVDEAGKPSPNEFHSTFTSWKKTDGIWLPVHIEEHALYQMTRDESFDQWSVLDLSWMLGNTVRAEWFDPDNEEWPKPMPLQREPARNRPI